MAKGVGLDSMGEDELRREAEDRGLDVTGMGSDEIRSALESQEGQRGEAEP